MKNVVNLKDGTEVCIRPMEEGDLEASVAFFRDLPLEDRSYLRVDVSRPEVVQARIDAMKGGRVHRLVGLAGDRIVADGALELGEHGWKQHVGEVRLIVARDFQRKGLGSLMTRELFLHAAKEKLEEVVVRFMRPQVGAQTIFRRLGFRSEVLLPDYVVDQEGHKQDLVVMRCPLQDLWEELEWYLAHEDWQRTR